MHPRLAPSNEHLAGAMKAMAGLESYIRQTGLDHSLAELVRSRVSQINSCAYCIDFHTQAARSAGETDRRLHALSAWREAPFFTDRERTALEWAEELTLIAERRVPDELYERALREFSEAELVALTLCVVAINGWNRIQVPFRALPAE